ncbi:pyruvate kinase, partial [Salmonella enterica subsp. enterica serovar Anatum]|nr:pyruvate kinase [Salmonella enterica subsp. enterica serovar Anatum]
IVAKVERAEAVCDQNAMDDIILASDVVMVARGDLGVEIGDPETVIHTVANRLRELNPDMDIHISSTDAKVYIPTGQQVTVLIHY